MYELIKDGTLEIGRKWSVLPLLKKLTDDDEFTAKHLTEGQFTTVLEFIDDLKRGDLELYAPRERNPR